MNSYVASYSNLNSFDYERYLKKFPFSDMEQLNFDRDIANRQGLGDEFLYTLTDVFLKKYPPTINDIEDSIAIGEKFLEYSSNKGAIHDEIYKSIGYYILSKCVRVIEKDTRNKPSSWLPYSLSDNTRIEALTKRLKDSNINIRLKRSLSSKVWGNIRSGNFAYIFDRICKKFCTEDEIVDSKSQIELKKFKVDNTVDSNIFYLLKDSKNIGEIIFLEREIYKAHYMVKDNVYTRYKKTLAINKLESRVALTAGYSNIFREPEGLSIENGNIVNAALMEDIDGLVLIEKNGEMSAINLKNSSFILPNSKGTKIKDLNNIIDYVKLLKWARLNKATFFQTHLLAFNDKVLIEKGIANSKYRERRLLVLGSNQDNDKMFDCIVNVREGVSLASITMKVFDLMKLKNYKVNAILNLDVGRFDIIEVYNPHGQRVLNGPVSISKAKNLLFYTNK